jgi:Fungalysin/Thermolysin Propeptide Motif
MRRSLTSILALAIAITVSLMPPLTRALPQGQSGARNPQAHEVPSGKIVDSYRRGDPGIRPVWVETALARSLAHLRQERAALGLANPDTELSLFSAVRDDLGQTHVRLDQVYQGVPVFNGQIIAHLDVESAQPGQSEPFTTGRLFKGARLVNTTPRLDSAAALAIAKRTFGRSDSLERENVELVILPEAAKRSGSDASGAELTYKVANSMSTMRAL